MSVQQDKRLVIYPNYLDSKKTVAEGRRIPLDKACESPNVVEMLDSCKHLKIPAEIQNKHYPRDWMVRGRLRVQLQDEKGQLCNPSIPDKRTLMLKMAELVPKHFGRHKKVQPAPVKQEAASSGANKSSKKKKGKK